MPLAAFRPGTAATLRGNSIKPCSSCEKNPHLRSSAWSEAGGRAPPLPASSGSGRSRRCVSKPAFVPPSTDATSSSRERRLFTSRPECEAPTRATLHRPNTSGSPPQPSLYSPASAVTTNTPSTLQAAKNEGVERRQPESKQGCAAGRPAGRLRNGEPRGRAPRRHISSATGGGERGGRRRCGCERSGRPLSWRFVSTRRRRTFRESTEVVLEGR
mmetsp:Transcript_13454/g.25873  ORF Transcript_13454/g.25873 Transcript_13454/m.25873 type:complete len:215 (+) Transcript_13454:1631-2275(+)